MKAEKIIPLIVKLLQLTTSPNENEARSSIAKANEILKNNELSWATIFGLTREDLDMRKNSSRLIAMLAIEKEPGQRKLLSDFNSYLIRNGHLSEKQEAVLEAMWEQHKLKHWQEMNPFSGE